MYKVIGTVLFLVGAGLVFLAGYCSTDTSDDDSMKTVFILSILGLLIQACGAYLIAEM